MARNGRNPQYVSARDGTALGGRERKRRRGGKLPERPINFTGRRQAGYAEVDIQQVLDWGYATP